MSHSSEIELLTSIDGKLDRILKLQTIASVKGLGELEQIKILRSKGLTSDEIGSALGMSGALVRMKISAANKKGKNKGGKNGRK